MDKSTLGARMKKYERSYDYQIIGRIPIIIRLDGKGFSKWTKKCKFIKPFDHLMSGQMSRAMKETAEKIEGCMFSYTQSDEITFVLRNDQSLEATPWFDNRIQKIGSVVNSIFTAHFNNFDKKLYDFPLAYFDARVFAVPTKSEILNGLIWRQNDCVKNSISAACYYEVAKIKGKKTTRKMMHGLNQKQQQELLFAEAGINWNDYPIKFKRGSCCYRVEYNLTIDGNDCVRSKWVIDNDMPIITKNRKFLEDILWTEADEILEE